MLMRTAGPITFVIAVNNREVFEQNFLASPCLKLSLDHQILIQENFTSAAEAYNDAIDRSANDLIVFCHQDVILPNVWLSQLQRSVEDLSTSDPKWGVLGSYGNTQNGSGWGHVYSSGEGTIGDPLERPAVVQTLDEIVLILRRSSGLRFDNSLPHFHFYGTDICLRAAKRAMKSYAIPGFCIHNTNQTLVLPHEFYECYSHIKRVWKEYLPIQTTCIKITKFNIPAYIRRVRECHLRYVRHTKFGGTRVEDPLALLQLLVGEA
jgi:hypothetical protein